MMCMDLLDGVCLSSGFSRSKPETRFYMQAVCLEGDPKKDGGRASEAGKGRQSLKLGLSSRLPLWAPADFGKWYRTCLRVIPPLCSRDVGC